VLNKKNSKNKLKNCLIILILLLAFILRIFSISDNHVFFFFDQARDAVISTSIINDKDLKIMGPSVSGTNDSLYHGVFYYYLIAPIYVISKGNPFIVSVYLSAISLIGIFVTYKLGKMVFKSESIGLLAAFFQSISVISINQATWLSNPNLSAIFIPTAYYFVWKIFLSEKNKNL